MNNNLQRNLYCLSKELAFDEQELLKFDQRALDLKAIKSSFLENPNEVPSELEIIEREILAETIHIARINESVRDLQNSIQKSLLREFSFNQNVNALSTQCKELQDDLRSIQDDLDRSYNSFDKLLQINVLNDAFYVWYAGPYGTINNFRLGNTSIKPIESNELNAGLGEASLAIYIIASRCGIDLKNYCIIPMGSFPKIVKVEDRTKTVYPLYIDQGSFSFFPKRNFNLALTGFLHCLNEIGDFVASYDPTMGMPYKINIQELKIGDISFTYGVDDEIWTRSLKFVLSNIKWIIAWYSKHGKSLSVSTSTTSII